MEKNINTSELVKKTNKYNILNLVATIGILITLGLGGGYGFFYYKNLSKNRELNGIEFNDDEIIKLRESLSIEVQGMSEIFILNTAIANIFEIYNYLNGIIANNKTSTINNELLITQYLTLNKIDFNLAKDLPSEYKLAIDKLKIIISEIYRNNNGTEINEVKNIGIIGDGYGIEEARDFFERNR